MMLHHLDRDAVAAMAQVDLASLGREPESMIDRFTFHGCTCGVAAFKGSPPWEHHTAGDELLFVLAGRSVVTIVEDGSRTVQEVAEGDLVVIPKGCWHRNDSDGGVTLLYLTPDSGNEHAWEEPGW